MSGTFEWCRQYISDMLVTTIDEFRYLSSRNSQGGESSNFGTHGKVGIIDDIRDLVSNCDVVRHLYLCHFMSS